MLEQDRQQRALLDSAERDRAPAIADLKGAEYAKVHWGAPADSTVPRHTPPASSGETLCTSPQLVDKLETSWQGLVFVWG
jgi:hypothetical protein